jgi:hypothetical protein
MNVLITLVGMEPLASIMTVPSLACVHRVTLASYVKWTLMNVLIPLVRMEPLASIMNRVTLASYVKWTLMNVLIPLVRMEPLEWSHLHQ